MAWLTSIVWSPAEAKKQVAKQLGKKLGTVDTAYRRYLAVSRETRQNYPLVLSEFRHNYPPTLSGATRIKIVVILALS